MDFDPNLEKNHIIWDQMKKPGYGLHITGNLVGCDNFVLFFFNSLSVAIKLFMDEMIRLLVFALK